MDIFRPLGLGDELRVALGVHGTVWGFMCLHREPPEPFSAPEVRFVRRIAPHVATAIRVGLATHVPGPCPVADAPGVLLLGADASLLGSTPAADRWLEELGFPAAAGAPVPAEIHAVAAGVLRPDAPPDAVPRLLVRTRAGRWAVLHASRLPAAGRDTVVVVVEEAPAADVAPVVMLSYALTAQERTLTGLVCQGRSTAEIAARLRVSTNTVQDHLKSVFDKVGVRSRRELAARILREQYLPRARAGRAVGPGGFFV
jgi:DNA-binding CsgD family transcriptional regulator